MSTIRVSGVQHIGIPVSNIERSLQWYEEMLGLKQVFIAEGSGEEVSAAVGVPNAHLKFAFMQAGNTIFELLEYVAPVGRPQDRGNNDIGACHVAFEVDDIDDAVAKLTAKGVKFNAPPLRIDSGPLAGCAFAYFPDPDGVQLELFQVAK
jgi:catechol 2,3-dioxygenase-like lactoylglutathione lyase family enzyme